MMRQSDRRMLLATTLLLLAPWSVCAQQAQEPSTAQVSLSLAQQSQKYLFILFWKEDNPATQTVKQTLDAALASRSVQAASVMVNVNDPGEKAVVDQFGVSRSPMPLVLAVAPNGAITGGFALKLTEQEVAAAFVTPGTAACLKATQAKKLVLLCVQPAEATYLPAGVREFKADPQYGPATEVITLRSGDPAESAFLNALKIQPAPTTVTAFIVPPGSLLGTFDGAVTKQQFVEKLRSAQNSCCPGGKCGPGGCCPGGKPEAKP